MKYAIILFMLLLPVATAINITSNYGYDYISNIWRPFAVTPDGRQMIDIDLANVSVGNLTINTGGYICFGLNCRNSWAGIIDTWNTTSQMIIASNSTGLLINWSTKIVSSSGGGHNFIGPYLYNNSINGYFNETKLNLTIDVREKWNTTSQIITASNSTGLLRNWTILGFIRSVKQKWFKVTNYELDLNETTLNQTIDAREKWNTTTQMKTAVNDTGLLRNWSYVDTDTNTWNNSAQMVIALAGNLTVLKNTEYNDNLTQQTKITSINSSLNTKVGNLHTNISNNNNSATSYINSKVLLLHNNISSNNNSVTSFFNTKINNLHTNDTNTNTRITTINNTERNDNSTQATAINLRLTTAKARSDFLNKTLGAVNLIYSANHWLGNNTWYDTSSARLVVNGSMKLKDALGVTKITLNGSNGFINATGGVIIKNTNVMTNLSTLRLTEKNDNTTQKNNISDLNSRIKRLNITSQNTSLQMRTATGWNKTGTSVFLLRANDTLGIGTKTPTDSVYIYNPNSSADERHGLSIEDYRPHINLNDKSGNADDYQLRVDQNTFSIKYEPSDNGVYNTTRMYIRSTGQVAFGSNRSFPSTDTRLWIYNSQANRFDVQSNNASEYSLFELKNIIGANYIQGITYGTSYATAPLTAMGTTKAGSLFLTGYGGTTVYGNRKDNGLVVIGTNDEASINISKSMIKISENTNFTKDLIVDGTTFQANGTANKVGIGTRTPLGRLEVYGEGADVSTRIVAGTNGAQESRLYIGTTANRGWNIISKKYNGSTFKYDLVISPNSFAGNLILYNESFNGNVGIRTSTPNSQLQVKGNVTLNNTLYVQKGKVGIGTNLPIAPLQLQQGSATALNTTLYNTGFDNFWSGNYDNAAQFRLHTTDDAFGSNFVLQRSKGTFLKPTALTIGDTIGSIWMVGYGGTNRITSNIIYSQVDDVVSTTKVPAQIVFTTYPAGAEIKRMIIKSNGVVNITNSLVVDGTLLQVNGTSNRVGIGTRTPSHVLSVIGNVNISAATNIYFGDNDDDAAIKISDGTLCVGNAGCSTPATSGSMNIEGGFLIDTDGTITEPAGGFLTIGDGTDGAAGIEIEDGSMCIGDGGCTAPTNDGELYVKSKVGIGTIIPKSLLHVNSSRNTTLIIGAAVTPWITGLNFTHGASTTASLTSYGTTGEVRSYASTNYYPTWYSNTRERMRITTAGQVGINLTATRYTLNVKGTVNVTDNSGAGVYTDGAGNVNIRLGV